MLNWNVQTVELYSPVAEYDLETVGSVLYSLVATAFVALVSVFACFPDSKITMRIKKMLKKIAPQLMEQPGYVNVDISVRSYFIFSKYDFINFG